MENNKIDFNQKKQEQYELKRVSELIGEVRPYFLNQIQKKKAAKTRAKAMVAAVFVLFLGFFSTVANYEYDIVNSIVYHDLSAQDMGFPTDEYGFIMVE